MFQVYNKVYLLHVYLCLLFFKFFSHIGCYNKDIHTGTGNSTQYSVVDPTFIVTVHESSWCTVRTATAHRQEASLYSV